MEASVVLGEYGPEITYSFAHEDGVFFSRVLVRTPASGRTFMFNAGSDNTPVQHLLLSSATAHATVPMIEAICTDPKVSIMFSGGEGSRVVTPTSASREQACKALQTWKDSGGGGTPRALPTGEAALGILSESLDPVSRVITYTAPSTPPNSCVDATIFAAPGTKGKPSLVVYFTFEGASWIFLDKVEVRSGEDLFRLPIVNKPYRRVSPAGVREVAFFDMPDRGPVRKALRAMCADPEAIARLHGSDGHFDCTLTIEGREALCIVINAYDYMKQNSKTYRKGTSP
jgi:hypothetical protein